MLSLIFIQFLVFTAYCEFSVVNQVIKDPLAFAQTFSQASPDQINEVVKIIEGLISTGEAKKKDIIDTRTAADAVLSKANADLATALDEFETARGERKLADEWVTVLKGKLDARTSEQSAALKAKNLAAETLQDAQDWFTQESERIDIEKAIFKDVIEVLTGLKDNSGRRLLSSQSHLAPILSALIDSAKVNPDSIDKVVALVVDLINAGEAVRTEVDLAKSAAQKAFDKADSEWKAAVQATIAANDKHTKAVTTAADKLVVEQAKESIWNDATASQEAAQVDKDKKLKIEQEQVPVIDHENAELRKVVDILKNMIKKMD